MRPELFSLASGVDAPSYFVLLLSGFLFATALGALWARRIGASGDVIVDLGLAALLSGVIGGRLLHVLADGHFTDYVHLCTDPSRVDWPLSRAQCLSPSYGGVWDVAKSACHPAHADCFAWAKFWTGGLTYYGGFIAALLTAYVVLTRDHFSFWKAIDMSAFAIPLGLAFGRVGCLLAGCCFGAPSHLPWALSFPAHSPAADEQARDGLLRSADLASLPVHPTQIYESLGSLAISAVCLFLVHPRKRYDGQVFVAFLLLYSVMRALLEILRRDDRGGALGLSTSQLLGVVFVAIAAALHLWRRPRHDHRNPDAGMNRHLSVLALVLVGLNGIATLYGCSSDESSTPKIDCDSDSGDVCGATGTGGGSSAGSGNGASNTGGGTSTGSGSSDVDGGNTTGTGTGSFGEGGTGNVLGVSSDGAMTGSGNVLPNG